MPGFTNARLVLEDRIVSGSLVHEGGTIAAVGAGPSRTFDDLGGDFLLPGLIEIHTDHLEKQLLPRTGVDWPPFEALLAHDAQVASAGITTVLDAIAIGNTIAKPERDAMLEGALEALGRARAQDALRAEHFLHIRCEVAHPDLAGLYDRFAGGEEVTLLSLMDHTPGARQYADTERYTRMLIETQGLGAEAAAALIEERRALSRAYGATNSAIIAADARRRGLRLASHDDATEEHVAEAVALGVAIAEFPTTREAAVAARAAGLATVMGAPNVVRGGSHSGNVGASELAREGLLDILSSDYMPTSLMSAPFRLAAEGVLGLPAAVRLVSAHPADTMGFADRGRLGVGLRADFDRVRLIEGTPVVRGVWRAGERIA